MTQELRPAVEVADDVWGEAEFCNIAASSAIIEADREAVRQQTVEQIVAWLRNQNQLRVAPMTIANAIEAGEWKQ